MKIIEIKDLIRKEFPIYYRRFYSGVAVLELVTGETEVPIDFQIEQKPTGHIEITVVFSVTIDYPLVPLQKMFKRYIKSLDEEGKLPN